MIARSAISVMTAVAVLSMPRATADWAAIHPAYARVISEYSGGDIESSAYAQIVDSFENFSSVGPDGPFPLSLSWNNNGDQGQGQIVSVFTAGLERWTYRDYALIAPPIGMGIVGSDGELEVAFNCYWHILGRYLDVVVRIDVDVRVVLPPNCFAAFSVGLFAENFSSGQGRAISATTGPLYGPLDATIPLFATGSTGPQTNLVDLFYTTGICQFWLGGADPLTNGSITLERVNVGGLLVACEGDVDSSGTVDLSDLTTLLSHFGTLSGADRRDGDLDGDSAVSLTDLTILLSHFGTACAS